MSLRAQRSNLIGITVHKEEIAGGTGILPVIPNRQAGRLSHHLLLAMTVSCSLLDGYLAMWCSPARRGIRACDLSR